MLKHVLRCTLLLVLACSDMDDGLGNDDAFASSSDDLVSPDAFRVMTYNIRYQTDNDVNRAGGAHRWSNRRSAIKEMVDTVKPDIWGAQEAKRPVDFDVQSKAPTSTKLNIADDLIGIASRLGYRAFDSSKGAVGTSPKLIFFRDRFQAIGGGVSPLSGGSGDCAGGKEVSWLVLQDTKTMRKLFVMNTHLTAGACASTRQAQANEILSVWTKEANGLPTILMGDFNAQPDEGCVLSAKATFTNQGVGGTFNQNWDASTENDKQIDYLFYKNLAGSSYGVNRKRVRILGATISPSDHYPVSQRFSFL